MILLVLACVAPSKPDGGGLEPTSTETTRSDSAPPGPTDSGPTTDPDDGDADGHTTPELDCDDHDPTVYIGAPEVPGDGVDQNCDGLDGAPAVTLSDFAVGDWTVPLRNRLCMATYSGASIVADVTGDGGLDVLVGIPGSGDADTAVDCQSVAVLDGPAFDVGDMTEKWAEGGDWDHFEDDVYAFSAGDWSGDGIDDVALVSDSVYVLTAITPGRTHVSDAYATISPKSPAEAIAFGFRVSPSGQAAGLAAEWVEDGVGVTGLFSPMGGAFDTTAAWSKVELLVVPMEADLTGDGLEDFGYFDAYSGLCLRAGPVDEGFGRGEDFACLRQETQWSGQHTAAADTNSDGYADLLVGAGQNDHTYTASGGRAGLFFGPFVGDHTLSEADMIVAPESAGKALGFAVALGDLDADGDAELVLGAPMGDAGAVVLFEDAAPGVYSTADADLVLAGGLLGDYAGYHLSTGDLDADGHDDLAVAAPYDSSVVSMGGRLYLVSGADVAARW